MDINNVRDQINQFITDGILQLTPENDLNSPNINTILTTYFAGQLIANVNTPVIQDERVIYNGTLNTTNFSLYPAEQAIEMVIAFFLLDQVIQCSLTVTIPEPYRFADSFAALQNAPALPINSVEMGESVFTIDSTADAGHLVGFRANLQTSGLFQDIAWLLPGDLTLTGDIQIQTTAAGQLLPAMELLANVSNPVTLAVFELDLQIRLRAAVNLPDGQEPHLFLTSVELVTTFITPHLTIPVVMPIYGAGQHLLSFSLDLAQPKPAIDSLDDLSGFSGNTDPGQSLTLEVPIGSLSLETMSVILDPATRQLVNLQLGVGFNTDWQIVDDILELKRIAVLFTIPTPSQPDNLSVHILAQLSVGAANLETYIFVPDNILRAQLIPDSTIDMSEALAYFANGVGLPGSHDLSIYEMNVFADLTQNIYSLQCQASGELTVIEGFVVTEIGLSLEYANQNLSQVVFGGSFTIAQTELHLLASRQADNWQLSGNTGPDQKIPIGTLITDLGNLFGPLTLPAALTDLTIENLMVSFNSATGNFSFAGEGTLPINGRNLETTLTIDITRQPDNTYTKRFGGHIMIGGLQFDLLFVQDAASNHFVAAYSHTAAVQPLPVKTFVASLSETVANYIPASMEVDLQDVLFAYRRDETASQFVFGLDIGSGFNLSQLPLVGGVIAPDQTIGVDHLQIIVASSPITSEVVGEFNGLLPEGITHLPDRMLDEGVNVAATINFGGSMELLNLPVRGGETPPPAPMPVPDPTPRAIPVATADNAKWYTLQKSFGPVHFERIGVQYQNSALLFLLDASLSAAGLTLTLDGLGFGASLNPFTPRFDLKGLGLDYRNGPLEIGGAFLRETVQLPDGEIVDEYDGAAVIRTSALTLSAVGSYARLNGQPSLFIYAVLDYPLGGPSFFFVTGLAAGFGYNRSLNVPDVGRVADFALVREAVSISTGATPSSLADTLNNLRNDVPIDLGQNFLAVGIKFTSFKLIDSFILVTVSFGNRFELDILGLSTLVVPTPLPGDTLTPLAEVQMALKASFIPDEGFLGVSAQLTDASYILSRACHLQGGFAFFAWFSGPNVGDFVQTLGGYHPDFRPPAHYPTVPRLGFNWRVNGELTLKGEAYYALTPSALMAGGHLQGSWHSGRLMACFNVGADFIIAWKPYHYDARANANLMVHYTFSVFGVRKRISVDVGANLHLWGPEFSGTAHIHLSVVSFDIRFGSRASAAQAIDWQAFRASFLPADDEDIVSLVVAGGLIQELTDETGALTGWIVNPKQFTVATSSVIPVKSSDTAAGPFESNVGIAAMGVQPVDFASTYTITVTGPGDQPVGAIYEPILKDAPAGLWGQQLLPTLNDPALIANTLAGFTIKPAGGPIAGTTLPINRNQLQFSTTPAQPYDLTSLVSFVAESLDETARRDIIRSELVNETTVTARADLLAALDIGETITLSNNTADVFVMAPQILV
ncbi:hypothetical protein GC175_28225 [bacterium]|nr:hypothetical protein [bacterium]